MKGGRVGPLRVDARDYSTKRLQIRATAAELARWKAVAAGRRMTLSNFVRQAVKRLVVARATRALSRRVKTVRAEIRGR